MPRRKYAPNFKEIDGPWDFLAWFFNAAFRNVWKVVVFIITAGILISGFSVGCDEEGFSFKKTPVEIPGK